jgi:hypothetical protein
MDEHADETGKHIESRLGHHYRRRKSNQELEAKACFDSLVREGRTNRCVVIAPKILADHLENSENISNEDIR